MFVDIYPFSAPVTYALWNLWFSPAITTIQSNTFIRRNCGHYSWRRRWVLGALIKAALMTWFLGCRAQGNEVVYIYPARGRGGWSLVKFDGISFIWSGNDSVKQCRSKQKIKPKFRYANAVAMFHLMSNRNTLQCQNICISIVYSMPRVGPEPKVKLKAYQQLYTSLVYFDGSKVEENSPNDAGANLLGPDLNFFNNSSSVRSMSNITLLGVNTNVVNASSGSTAPENEVSRLGWLASNLVALACLGRVLCRSCAC